MFFTLHRYIFRELLKIFLLALIALTLILTLGSILSPIQEYGVGPGQVFHLLGYFLPVTLTFVLPMAALFASTLSYGRLAGDNELDACKASGISPLSIIYPGLVLAILVTIANLVLSFHVMPYFVHCAESAIKADAKQILFRNIQRQGYYRLPDSEYAVYADHADQEKDVLSGVIVVETHQGRINKIIAAEKTRVAFESHGQSNEVQISAYNATQIDDNMSGKLGNIFIPRQFPSLLGDQIDFKRINEMKAIQADLTTFYPIRKLALDTRDQAITEMLMQDIRRSMAENTFYELGGEPNSVRFKAAQCELKAAQDIVLTNLDVLVFDTQTGRSIARLTCEKAVLTFVDSDASQALSMELSNASRVETPAIIMHDIVHGLAWPRHIVQKFAKADLISRLQPDTVGLLLGAAPTPALERRCQNLERLIQRTLIEIQATIHSRMVFGIGCIPMIVIGIALGIIKRGGHVLSAFAVSCFPAIILVVCIICGKHIAENPDSTPITGYTIMWSGLAMLVLIAMALFRRLYRN